MEHLLGETILLGCAAFTGAVIQELAWWYELRHELQHDKYATLMRSPAYWVVVALMIAGSTAGPIILHWDTLHSYSSGDFMVFGAAFPLIFKQLTGGAARQTRKTRLGTVDLMENYILRRG